MQLECLVSQPCDHAILRAHAHLQEEHGVACIWACTCFFYANSESLFYPHNLQLCNCRCPNALEICYARGASNRWCKIRWAWRGPAECFPGMLRGGLCKRFEADLCLVALCRNHNSSRKSQIKEPEEGLLLEIAWRAKLVGSQNSFWVAVIKTCTFHSFKIKQQKIFWLSIKKMFCNVTMYWLDIDFVQVQCLLLLFYYLGWISPTPWMKFFIAITCFVFSSAVLFPAFDWG